MAMVTIIMRGKVGLKSESGDGKYENENPCAYDCGVCELATYDKAGVYSDYAAVVR